MENRIKRLLLRLGIAPSLCGYKYLTDAVRLCYEDRKYMHLITSRLYPDVARANSTTASRVERSIRHAIESSSLTPEDMEQILIVPSVRKEQYVNSLFICACVEVLKLEENENA